MDDFPASPTGSSPRRPALSVVVPVYNGGRDLERSLRGLRASSWTDFEIVVVDDGSTDDSSQIAERFGARVLRREAPKGPASARNDGAAAALAPIVFFVDADVVVHADALGRAVACFEADASLAALFGSYDTEPAHRGVVSSYRNLLHHFVHQQGVFQDGIRPAHTFWTGCGAIRREVFLEVGGFDPRIYRRPAIEDIELGYRLSQAGHKVALARDIRATHLKRWTIRQIIKTDIFQRGVPWMVLMLRSGVAESDLNVSRSQRATVAALGLGFWGLLAAPWFPAALLVCVLGFAVQAYGNREFYRFLARLRGWWFAARAFPLHTIYFACCAASVAIALAVLPFSGRIEPKPPSGIPAPKGIGRARRRTKRWPSA